MAQRALTAGMTVPRRRAMFGLLDADGWAWATVKAFVWTVIIVLLLGYIPDRAYYLTVARTVDFGVLAWSPINLCPPTNKTLPCPVPVGGIVPWDASPPELALPQARTDGSVVQVGTRLLYIGGSDGTTAQSAVFVAPTVGTGNFDKWAQGPALPAPRNEAAVAFVAGSVYVMGGLDADGAPTTTTYVLTPDGTTGELGEWKEAPEALILPEARSGAAATATADGMLLIGGSNVDGPVNTTWKSTFDTSGALGKWAPEQPLAAAQTGATAGVVGDFVWVFGGADATGPVATVQRGEFGQAAIEGLPANPDEGKVVAWATNPTANLPGPRADAAAWAVNGALYVAGGTDGSAAHKELYWALPSNDGDIAEWKHLDVSDLPVPLTGGAPVVSGPNAIIVGGTTPEGVVGTSYRANIAPQAPFFRLGLLGATVPGLTVGGEIGQQLGYLNAAGAGTLDFVILIFVGWAYAHKAQARALFARVLRRRR
jgi:N-acetylneuraminic acid mutarotase